MALSALFVPFYSLLLVLPLFLLSLSFSLSLSICHSSGSSAERVVPLTLKAYLAWSIP